MQIIAETASDIEALALKMGQQQFDFVSLHGNCNLQIAREAPAALQQAKRIHGATSCHGIMSNSGANNGLGAFAICDPKGAYGTGMAAFEQSVASAAQSATKRALVDAKRIGEQPALVWVSATPGNEEQVIAGIEAVIGKDAAPIIGGSAADNDVSGDWSVFSMDEMAASGVVVSVLFPSVPISFAYQNGYSPTDRSGVVTAAEGRKIREIDGRPALDVYREWTGGAVTAVEHGAGSRPILSESTFWPLGREVSRFGDVPLYLLAHPSVAHDDSSIDLFANVSEGETLTQMNGTAHSLIERAGRVASLACASGRIEKSDVAGALMVYCGGCMLSVRDKIDEVAAGVADALDGAPFLGTFTFGEQGSLLQAGNRHGNLMISCIVFGVE
ncbi:MAG: FIST N-terminal domain-containing protein [Pseudomonadota bacterium]